MAIYMVKCPSCGSATELNDEKDFCFCTECGKKILASEAELYAPTAITPEITGPSDLELTYGYTEGSVSVAVTEEEDTVDGITDRWVRVSYGDCEGWVFGGYTSAERGGPKYYIPEQLIAFDLGPLP